MPLGTQVRLGPGHIVRLLDGDPAPLPEKGHTANFRPMFVVAKWSPISATAEHLLNFGASCISLHRVKLDISNLVCQRY